MTCCYVVVMAYLEINVLACRHILEVHFQDLLASLDIRVGHCDMAIKAARPDECFVQGLWEVSGCYTDDTIAGLKSAQCSLIPKFAIQSQVPAGYIQLRILFSRLAVFCASLQMVNYSMKNAPM